MRNPDTIDKSPMTDLAGLFFVSAALLALEIGLTRIFSTMIWFHFSFLAIGMVMLGFAAAGIALVALPRLGKTGVITVTAGLGFVLATGMGVMLMLFQPGCLQGLAVMTGPLNPRVVFAVMLVAVFTAAFAAAGLTVSTIIAGRPGDIGRVYCANLTGSAAGAVLVLPLLSLAGALHAMLIIMLTALCGVFCFTFSPGRRSGRRRAACALTAIGVITLIGITDGNTPFAESLLVRRDVTQENRLFRKWNSFSCVDFYTVDRSDPQHRESMWGLSSRYQGKMPELIKIIIDSWAVTATYKMDDTTLDLPFYDYLPANLAYALLSRPSVLVLGAGGGIDILSALHYQASAVTGIEINPSIVGSVKNELAEYAGNIYNRPDLPIHVAEGRHWLSRDPAVYDLIHLSGVDSMSGALSGAYCFSESYLYTVNAFGAYLDHLTDEGIVSFLRFGFSPPMEMLRLFTTATAALAADGAPLPRRHLMVVHSNAGHFAVLLMKKSPFTPIQIRTIDAVCQDKGFSVLYSPDRWLDNAFYAFVNAPNPEPFYDRYPFRIAPVTDNNPFFFNYPRLSTLFKPLPFVFLLYFMGQMVLLFGTLFLLALFPVFALWPVAIYRKQRRPVTRPFFIVLYFTGIGIAFMLVENVFIQKFSLFLGQPVYALALVLFCVLVFAGLGSYWAGRQNKTEYQMRLVSWGLPALIIATFFGADILFSTLLHTELAIRLPAAAALLAPCCFLMGLPFPLGVRAVEQSAPETVPWAWALNSYASVLGAFFAVISGISLGFAATCGAAAAIYAACGLIAHTEEPVSPRDPLK